MLKEIMLMEKKLEEQNSKFLEVEKSKAKDYYRL